MPLGFGRFDVGNPSILLLAFLNHVALKFWETRTAS